MMKKIFFSIPGHTVGGGGKMNFHKLYGFLSVKKFESGEKSVPLAKVRLPVGVNAATF